MTDQANDKIQLDDGRICIPNIQGNIGGVVWLDVNGSGRKGNDEEGIPNVAVMLYDNSGCKLKQVMTDKNGRYSFPGLSVGHYRVVVDRKTLPDPDYKPTFRRKDTDIPMAPGEAENDADFGFCPPYDTIGGQVWLKKKEAQAGVKDVAVTLSSENKAIHRTTRTTAKGTYRFHQLPPGKYTISLNPDTLPDNVQPVADRDGKLDHQTTVTLQSGRPANDANFGYRLLLGSIGDLVWLDYNRSGRKGNNEEGIPSVTVMLYTAAGKKLAQTVTTADGKYRFTDLPTDSYRVVIDPSTLPDPCYEPTFDLDGGRDHETIVQLAPGENDCRADFGYRPPLGSIGDRVWLEHRGERKGISGVAVSIASTLGNIRRTMQTSPEGMYRFHNLPPGHYTISLKPNTLPQNVKQTHDRDGELDHQTSVYLNPGQDIDDADFGYRQHRRWWLLPLALLGWLAFLALLLYCCRQPQQADLVIEVQEMAISQQFACNGVIVGETAVSVTVSNVGNQAAGSFVITLNGSEQAVDGLDAGESATFTFDLPDATTLEAVADTAGQVAESNEDNNRDAVTLTLETVAAAEFACQPDLAVIVAPQCSNDGVTLWAHVGNYGVVDVAAPVLHINGETVAVGSLAAGEQRDLAGLAWDGSSTITAVIDPNNTVAEQNEANNEYSLTLNGSPCSTGEIVGPELFVVLSASCVDEQTAVGQAIVINSGTSAVEQVEVSINGEVQTVTRIDAAATETVPFTVAAEEITAVVDPNDQISEANEANNSASITVDTAPCRIIERPDLTVDITVNAATADCSMAKTAVTVTVTNHGPNAVGEFTLTIGSEKESISGLGGDKSLAFNKVIAASTITAMVDADNQIDERNENNNSATATVDTETPLTCVQPDLTVAIGCDLDAPNQAYRVTVETRNDNMTSVGSFQLSLNGQTAQVDGLAQGAKAQQTFSFPVGTADFIARVDTANQIAESNERNNQSVLYIDLLPSSSPCRIVAEGCTRIDFEIGREATTGVRQEGTFVVREATNGRFVTSWRARVGETDSGLMRNFTLSRSTVHVTVDFVPDGGSPVRMEILNPAPNTPYGWLSNGMCHALEVQYPVGG
ncbi:MAG: hypothetical protein H6668_10975 [Ardenticatenaceae bacterium]|nr:hypothetical protein [Ardenticatenaceae bacterium]